MDNNQRKTHWIWHIMDMPKTDCGARILVI